MFLGALFSLRWELFEDTDLAALEEVPPFSFPSPDLMGYPYFLQWGSQAEVLLGAQGNPDPCLQEHG